MGKIIAIVNQKGGVGKTTTAVNLTAALGKRGKKCLLADLDPQGNATSGLGVDKRDVSASSYDLIIGEEDAKAVIRETGFDNLSLIPSGISLAGAEIELVDAPRREHRLMNALSPLRQSYDFIIIDCPPAMGLLALNGLCAADNVLVPIPCEYYALEGLSQMIGTIRQVKRTQNETLELAGVLLTMYDKRMRLTQQVESEVRKFLPNQVYKTVIPRSVRLAEAPGFGQPIQYYDRSSKGAKAYNDLAKEFLKKTR